MKTTLLCLFLFLGGNLLFGQVYLSEKKAVEDIDFYFSKLDSVHPNMYWLTPKTKLDSFILALKKRCKDSIMVAEFQSLLAEGNHLFDSHTGVVANNEFCVENYLKEHGDMVFPRVLCDKDGVFLRESGDRVLSVNGLPVTTLLEEIRKKLGGDMNPDNMYLMLSFSMEFQNKLMCMGIVPPFRVEVKTGGGRDSVLHIAGERLGKLQEEIQNALGGLFEGGPFGFEIYPENSIAIIRFYVCDTTGMKSFFSDCFEQIGQHGIKNVFIDVALNGGGTTQACELFLDHLDFTCKMKATMGSKENGVLKYKKAEYVKKSRGGYKGNVYVFQSFLTTSSGMFIGEILKSSGNGVLVGTETGGCMPVYTDSEFFNLKNSAATAYCASQHYRHISSRLPRDKSGFLLPDIVYPFRMDKRLEMEDCMKIISLNKR